MIFVFNLLLKKKFNWLDWKSLHNHYIYKTKPPMEEEVISTGEENPKKNEKVSGPSGDSPLPSSSKGIRRLRDEEFAIVENSPLVKLGKVVNERIDELGLEIDPEPIFHAIRVQYLFGMNETPYERKSEAQLEDENRLYDKIVENLKPWFKKVKNGEKKGRRTWNDQGWAWPELFIDPINKIPAHFSIQMHENGRFIIPLKRDLHVKEFFHDISLVFSQFLSREELESFLSYLLLVRRDGNYFRKEDGTYYHLAHKIGPDEVIEENNLNHACVKIRIINYGRNPRIKVYIDKSREFEIEAETDSPEGQDIFEVVKNATIVSGNLNNINQQLKVVDSDLNYLMNATNTSIDNGQILLQTIQNQHQDTMNYVSEVDAHLNNVEIQSQIRHEDLIHKLKVIKKEFPQLKDLFIEAYKNNSEENIKLREFLANTIVGIMNLQSIVHEDHEQILNEIPQVFLDISNDMNDQFEGVHGAINGAKDEIVQVFNDKFDTFKDLVFEEFKDVRFAIKHSLYLILRKIDRVPGLTAKELSKDMKVSQKTVYNYLKRLEENGIVISGKKKTSGRGRPSRSFTLNLKKILKLKEK